MKKAETRARDTGKLLRDGAVPMMDDSVSMLEPIEGTPHRAFNMLIPIASMVLLMPTFLIYTGWGEATGTGMDKAWSALSKGVRFCRRTLCRYLCYFYCHGTLPRPRDYEIYRDGRPFPQGYGGHG